MRGAIDQPGKLTLFGGGVEQGEACIDAAAREVEEELGIVPEPDALRFIKECIVENGGEYIHVYYYLLLDKVDVSLLISEEGEIELASWESLKMSDQLTPLLRAFASDADCENAVLDESRQADPITLP